MNPPSIPGEYYLQGVRETASGFLLNYDGTFQFFFSYGALDRQGSGTWKLTDDKIVFNSRTKPGFDFSLVESKKTNVEGITIRIQDNNPHLLRYVYASLEAGKDHSWIPASDTGVISFPQVSTDSISLLFEFCPERFSSFKIENDHNDFTFRFEPWLVEVFLSDFTLQTGESILTGGHPLMTGDEYRYEKHSDY